MASSNWHALQKTMRPTKRRKVDHTADTPTQTSAELLASSSSTSGSIIGQRAKITELNLNGDASLQSLREMVHGRTVYSDAQKLPGKYLSLDCEMVGVGIEGSESSLARVSIVNFHGAVLLDEFVSQKERIVDYRTQWSGIRPADMVHARPFEEVQQKVSSMLKDRILIGHAVFNDLKALLLDHPRQYLRDTQHLAYKHKVVKGKRPALRNLVKQELGLTIQEGEHSSVTDARATMAIFRLHKKEWEKNAKPLPANGETDAQAATTADGGLLEETSVAAKPSKKKNKRSAAELEEADEDSRQKPPDNRNRKGISSGLSVVVKRIGGKPDRGARSASSQGGRMNTTSKKEWWKQL